MRPLVEDWDAPTDGVRLLPMELDAPGTAAFYAIPKGAKTVPYFALGEGVLAPALIAGQVTRVTGGRSRGLSATACTVSSSDSWFVGGGGSVGRRTTVLLTNPDSTPALVDLEVYGPKGRAEARGGQGILVPARQQKAVRIDVLAPETEQIAVHVLARAGRVSSAVQDVNTKGLIPRGADFVPQSAPPAVRVLVPGVLGGTSGTRVLQVVAPGEADAIVNLKIVADDGTFAPESAALLEVPAGTLQQVDLSPFLDGIAAASVLLESDVPVVAGLRTVIASGAGAEVAYTAGTPALSGPAGFGPVTVDDARTATLFLSAADDQGLVTVVLLDPAGGAPKSQDVVVPGGTTTPVKLSGVPAGAGIVVTPITGSGPVQAVLLLGETRSDGSLLASVPLVSRALTVTVPPVRPDPATGIPGR